ncbi:AraC family transcriptional regulator [Rubinisphaera brasiliensis]|uniref:Transcriptional regulator, AraC family n=1 Tax=Rubinisphaera brasiliensis (strain ATCC 49424 / DSM 5305 / JCM 21570 / IAM 15109 / NBRC 103401 / IFAM 1448) TaxID=756272 RepID=F0SSW0_RUBBR|nr:AraC family transcriptional regulator [Rubinisphaera brasiliensis]ADY61438.1 transcriptional regulator, AraC family [Rubinisphaera brasiliensis DSM 5305]
MEIQLFDPRMLAPLVQFLDQAGVRSERFLHRARIPAELVEVGGWIGKRQAYDFTYDVVHRLRCREAVFQAYLEFEMAHLGPIANAMRACRTVKEALEVGARLGSTAYEGNEYFLEADGETTWFCYREPTVVSAGQTFINDMTLAVYCQLIRATADHDWRPEQFRTREDVHDRHRAVELFEDCQTTIHPHSTGLAFPTDFLSRRLPPPSTQLESQPENGWKFGPEDTEPVVEKLSRLVSSQFSYGTLPTLDVVGDMVDISSRTLKRQLRAAGTSYTGLLDRLRFDAACEMLTDPQMTIREIAHELGYSGPNNFVRSFRRMTGVTPGEYRDSRSL